MAALCGPYESVITFLFLVVGEQRLGFAIMGLATYLSFGYLDPTGYLLALPAVEKGWKLSFAPAECSLGSWFGLVEGRVLMLARDHFLTERQQPEC